MKKKSTTVLLVLITFSLLGLVFYVSSLLSKEQSQVTTIKKTKAASITYSKTIALNPPVTVTPTETIIAKISISTEPTLEVSPEAKNSAFLGGAVATPSPTSVLLTSNNITPSPTLSILASGNNVTSTVKPTDKVVSLPESGKSDYLVSLIIVASIIIFFSFLY